MTSAEIRQAFLDAFEKRGHTVVDSSPLVPQNDPTLFFVNAGMVQFKDTFTGAEPRDYARAVTVQKCLRVSGKHNDLENVGRTPRHHTFFEMLGNFSFGDYFKPDAIAFAWELLTVDLGLDAERLWVTVFEEDDEAFRIWTEDVGVPAARVQRMGAKDNFWSMGPTGPCGPCSEIHWDRGPAISDELGGPATEDDRYMEIWNLVFMQYEQHADGSRTDLPRPSIDTGMGFERITAVLQGVDTNYDTDVFSPLIQRGAELAGVTYGENEDTDTALRVIADHARATAFLIGDGVMPSNEDRGYVLRRIMRRAIRFGVKLELSGGWLFQVTDAVVDAMGSAYPELVERRAYIREVVESEERRFAETLHRGLQLLEQAVDALGESKVIPGDVAFKLYDTYGFPLDLTRQVAQERGIGVDEGGFTAEMEAQRARGRAAWKGSGEAALLKVGGLADALPKTRFTGYGNLGGDSEVLALIRDGAGAPALAAGDAGTVIVAESPFYAESGGQVGDQGMLEGPGGRFQVNDVQQGQGGLFFHHGTLLSGALRVGEAVSLTVDEARRGAIKLNHTATHLLHAALRNVLGEHVQQKGSMVSADRLRFDFSHHKSVPTHQLQAIEDMVYGEILGNTALETQLMDLDAAKDAGAMALFGEKYADEVRVVRIGDYSCELCGGTHVERTGDIGLFRLTHEQGIAAGVRRVEALTGLGAWTWARERDQAATTAAARLRSPLVDLADAIDRSTAERKRLERELDGLKRELARSASGDLTEQARDVGGIPVVSAEIPGDAGTLREEADRIRDTLGSAVVVLGSREGGKVVLVATASKDLAGKRVHAGNLVRDVAKLVGGGGGGRPDMAQAGGRNADALAGALEQVYDLVSAQL